MQKNNKGADHSLQYIGAFYDISTTF